jgi:hypothetical protein
MNRRDFLKSIGLGMLIPLLPRVELGPEVNSEPADTMVEHLIKMGSECSGPSACFHWACTESDCPYGMGKAWPT